ncbi:chorismate mutase [Pontibacter locisalis]|uniref:chorismate mutase n=1 Tax=Pontibacter locisalis TaxID=1719035 RepID=A0ABW5IK98_9BACT
MRASRKTIDQLPQSSFRKADGKLVMIAGPCSAESEEQMLKTAQLLKNVNGISVFKAGIWKSRTRPNSFEGVGTVGLQWLDKVKQETGLKTACDVANAQQAEEALKYGVDMLIISGRTTVNPFALEEIAAVLKGTATPLLINNPVYPDLHLWMGAIERFYKAGLTDVAAINRGFTADEQCIYRNHPRWDHMLHLKQLFPELPVLCDAAHIAGRRSLLYPVSQKAVDLGVNGLLFEAHHCPAEALSSPQQQLMPQELDLLINAVHTNVKLTGTNELVEELDELSQQIDSLDDAMLELMLKRTEVTARLGSYQKANVKSVPQSVNWDQVLESLVKEANQAGVDQNLLQNIFQVVREHYAQTYRLKA